MSERVIFAGFGQRDYTPEAKLSLLGQMHERIATGSRDPLMSVAMALRQDEVTLVIASLDLCMVTSGFVLQCQGAFERRFRIPGAQLIIHSTHTHLAPPIDFMGGFPCQVSQDFVKDVIEKLMEAVADALGALEPVELFAGIGQMEQMGWNRRAMFADGASVMYGNCEMPGYIGMEGPRDPDLPVLFAKNKSGTIVGVLVGFSSHPNSIEDEYVYSADFPGVARQKISVACHGVPVVYLTGAAGNTAPSQLDPYVSEQLWRHEDGVRRSGEYLGEVALNTIAAAVEPMESPILRFEQEILKIDLCDWPAEGEPRMPPTEPQESALAAYYRYSRDNWANFRSTESPVSVRLNIIRIGDVVICTNPGELFVEFGLEIKHHSSAKVTFIAELTDGYIGYLPTPKAFARGGYETWTCQSCRMDINAGAQIVDATKRLLDKVATTF